eukprot:2900199-Pyramimonas_sp.AAC.1
MAFDMEKNREFCEQVIKQLKEQVEFGDWHELQGLPEGATFTGRRFKQDEDYVITIDMDEYIDGMTDYRMPRERAKQEKELLTAAEHRALRGMNGQVQWVVRLLLHKYSFEASRLAGQMSKPT